METLLLNGASVNSKDKKWLTPLHRACCSGNYNVVDILLRYKADVKARDRFWQTPLHVAAANNAVQCVELILPYLLNLNVTDRFVYILSVLSSIVQGRDKNAATGSTADKKKYRLFLNFTRLLNYLLLLYYSLYYIEVGGRVFITPYTTDTSK